MIPISCVITKFIPQTEKTEARVCGISGYGTRRYLPWNPNLNIEENHQAGARLVLEKTIKNFNREFRTELHSLAHSSVGYVHLLMRLDANEISTPK